MRFDVCRFWKAALAASAFLAAALRTPNGTGVSGTDPEVWRAAASASTAGNGVVAVVPFRFVDRRIFVDVRVDGKGPFAFVVDTGSTDDVVDRGVAHALGIPSGSTVQVGGAGNGTAPFSPGRVRTWQVGPLALGARPVQIADLSPIRDAIGFTRFDGVVGRPTLSRYAVEFDYARRRIVFRDAERGCPRRTEPTPFDGAIPIVPVRFLGLHARAYVDTGDRSSFTVFGPFARAHDLYAHALLRGALTGIGVGGPIHSDMVRLPRLIAFHFGVENVVTRLSRQRAGAFEQRDPQTSLGNGVLARFDMCIDYARKTIVAMPTSDITAPDPFDRSGVWVGREDGRSVVLSVLPGSPAARAGLRAGDVVLYVDGTRDVDLVALRDRLASPAVTRVTFGVLRGGVRVTTTLHLQRLL